MAEPDAARPAQRTELPTDPTRLAPMGPAFDHALDSGLAELAIAGDATSPRARRSYELHARLLREWGAAINLTAIRDPADVARRHVIDSLTATATLEELVRDRESMLLDVGSGAGYPGLPLAAALRLERVGLLDSIGKKVRFLRVAAGVVAASLADGAATEADRGVDAGPVGTALIEAMSDRAEDLAQEPDERGSWDIVTARAVGPLAEVMELTMPLAREGGVVVAWKREHEGSGPNVGLRDELRDAGSIIRATGGGRPSVVDVATPSLPGHRLVVVRKERPTPPTYPRPAARRPHRKSKR